MTGKKERKEGKDKEERKRASRKEGNVRGEAERKREVGGWA
jgi:hypothetical protein